MEDQEQIVLCNLTEKENVSTQIDEDTFPSLDQVEDIISYKFNNKGLLEEAFTHSSYCEKLSYERLEYVGDSALNLLFTKEQYFMYPGLPPGSLTLLRSANVDTEKLARVAIKLGLHKFLRHKKPLLEEQVQEFSKAILNFPLHSNGLIDVPKDLADIIESTVGAVFIDSHCSIDTVWKVFKLLLEPFISLETLKKHPRTELNEVCQKHKMKLDFVDVWSMSKGIDVFVDDRLMGRGTCALKKDIAQNRAASDALNNIEKMLNEKLDHQDLQSLGQTSSFGT
ncbi:ribonuclease 3-like protein 3 [Mangifera indica]|uniref:ribonuclease 3-like protein 3 n=1 Tax=Mangifera indica TaxID=29780 RepID=UPI001CFAC924|nr:ribonuclease 3-like protein 3 [Mangifera indica]